MTPHASTSEAPWTIGRLLASARAFFQSKGIDEPRLAAELLLAKSLDCRKIELYTRFEVVPSDAQRAAFREWVKAAARGEPIAYLIGRKEFYSLDFLVTPDVLIPRPETELLVERVLAMNGGTGQSGNGSGIHVLDLGTGSGCIAVTIAVRARNAHVVATDSSAPALQVAAENAQRHQVADRLRFVVADWLDLPAEVLPPGGFDVVVSNPPYVAENQPDQLDENVRKYEPAAALFGGKDGLDCYCRIAARVGGVVRPGGRVLVELGENQADAAERVFQEANADRGLQARRFRDLRGIERVLELEFTS